VSGGEFNLGSREDFRLADRGLHRPEDHEDWQPTAALVLTGTPPILIE
jgi:hypothetical protein